MCVGVFVHRCTGEMMFSVEVLCALYPLLTCLGYFFLNSDAADSSGHSVSVLLMV